ncbi:MAG: type II secretion system secretin GspD [Janthinobacterium lividum]
MTKKRRDLPRQVGLTLIAGLLATLFAPGVYADVTLNFANADIDQVARAIGAATNRTIIVDPRVKGQLNLVSEAPVPDEQALKTLQSALRMQGFALLQDHGVLKVVPEADAKLQGVPTFIGNAPQARGDQVITQVFELHNESANNLLPVLRPLISPNNSIAAYSANNTLVITDYADNVRRLASIIAGIDGAAGREVGVVQLKNANALDVATALQKLLDPGQIGSSDATLKVNVIADPRTNSLLLRASNAGRIAQAKSLIAQLDAPTREPGNMHVVPLRNADATKLAKTLRGMMGQGSGSSDSAAASGSNGSSGLSALSNSNGSDSNGSGAGLGGLGGAGSSGAGISPLPGGSSGGSYGSSAGLGGIAGGNGSRASSGASGDDSSQGGMIQADASTNSLIITAPDAVYRNLRNVIDQLDQRRAQVYIEAIIAEVSSTSSTALGVQWQALLGGGDTKVYTGTNLPGTGNSIVDLTTSAYTATTTGTLPTLQQGLNIGVLHQFGNYLGLGALLQALASSSDTNILSTPNLITLDNEEAKIIVGQNVPVVTGSVSLSTTGATTPYQTYDRVNVGTVLDVKPQITEGGTIKLQLYQEDSSVASTNAAVVAVQGPTFNKRSIQSTILCDDGQIIALGGLISDQYQSGNSKVPWLGDIPLLGALFRTENKSRNKTNLMVFLRPVIVRDADASRDVALSRYDYMRAAQANYQSENKIVRGTAPQLPPAPPTAAEGGAQKPSLLDFNHAEQREGQPRISPDPAQQPPNAPDLTDPAAAAQARAPATSYPVAPATSVPSGSMPAAPAGAPYAPAAPAAPAAGGTP